MAINLAYATGSAVSITATETSLVSGTTTLQTVTDAGMFQLFVDGIANMVKGDEFQFRVYEKVIAGGTKRVIFNVRLTDVQVEPLVLPPLMLGIGWDMTAIRISATSRAFDWSIRRVS